MYIQNLMLQNFKCFEDVEVKFHPNLTVLIGQSGSGKTSIMEGIAIAMSAMFVKMDGVSGRSIEKSQAYLNPNSKNDRKDNAAQYPVMIKASAMTKAGRIQWSRSLESQTGRVTIRGAKEMIDLGMAFQRGVRNGDTALILPVMAYYDTKHLQAIPCKKQSDDLERNNRTNGYVDCMNGTTNGKLMMNWFLKTTIQKYQNQELGLGDIPELEAVYFAMETCYKKITGSESVKIRYNVGAKDLEISYLQEQGKWIRTSLSQLSDGYKSAITLVADITYRMAVLNPQLLGNVCKGTDGLVLIDGVDSCLEPVCQQTIFDILREIFPKVQFIVSSSDLEIIDAIENENIIMLKKEEME